jgi:hypothetical protein
MDPDQTARMRRLVWIHAGRKPIMLVCRDAAHLKIVSHIGTLTINTTVIDI